MVLRSSVFGVGQRRRCGVHRGRQIRQEAPRADERFCFAVNRVVYRTGTGLNFPAAEFLFGEFLADAFHHGWACDKHR